MSMPVLLVRIRSPAHPAPPHTHPAMSDSGDSDYADYMQYKILVVGDGAVGKTSLIMQFCDGGFKESYRQTVGLDFFNKRIVLPGQVNCTLQIWDIGGQQLGGKMLQNYMYGSHAILMVYDVTSLESFKNVSQWFSFVKQTFKQKSLPYIALVGNKIDLNHLRVVKTEKHSIFAVENSVVPYFVSAKTGDKVVATFTNIAADLAGIQLTKSELEAADAVVHAPIVNHPKAEGESDPAEHQGGDEEGKKDKKDCNVM